MRDLLLLASLLYLVPVSVARPWVGVLGWFWVSYFVPHSFTWGFGRRLPVAALIGGATLIGFLFSRERKPLPGTWSVILMFLFSVHMTITSRTRCGCGACTWCPRSASGSGGSRARSTSYGRRALPESRGLSSVSLATTTSLYSRGAFLGLSTVLIVLIWRSPWRLRFAAVVVVVALVAVPLAPQALKDRIASIRDQESAETRDGSAAGRLQAWMTSWRIATQHPLAGEGFRALWNEDVWNEYYGFNYFLVRDVHSVYFEVMSEHGLVGFGLYVALMASSLSTLGSVRRRWKGHAEYGYLSHYAEMNQLALYPFLVAGAFLSFAYFDLYFLLVATSTILKVLSVRAAETIAATATPPVAARPRALITRRPEPAPQPRPHHA